MKFKFKTYMQDEILQKWVNDVYIVKEHLPRAIYMGCRDPNEPELREFIKQKFEELKKYWGDVKITEGVDNLGQKYISICSTGGIYKQCIDITFREPCEETK